LVKLLNDLLPFAQAREKNEGDFKKLFINHEGTTVKEYGFLDFISKGQFKIAV
jgi:hypothetical protein